jgi:TetR/AcrR family transcriptional regulator, tetracycline repressor protein
LSRDRIVSAALTLVDREGLASLSMRRLAATLGVDPMAIYYYLPNKAALLDAIVEAVNLEMPVGSFEFPPALDDLVVAAGRVLRAILLRHPQAIPILAARPVATPAASKPADIMLGALVHRGLTPAEGIAAIDIFSTFITASVLRQVQYPRGPEQDPHVQLRQLKEALDEAESPNLIRALSEGNLLDFEAEFEFGLQALARGFAEVVATRAARQGQVGRATGKEDQL